MKLTYHHQGNEAGNGNGNGNEAVSNLAYQSYLFELVWELSTLEATQIVDRTSKLDLFSGSSNIKFTCMKEIK